MSTVTRLDPLQLDFFESPPETPTESAEPAEHTKRVERGSWRIFIHPTAYAEADFVCKGCHVHTSYYIHQAAVSILAEKLTDSVEATLSTGYQRSDTMLKSKCISVPRKFLDDAVATAKRHHPICTYLLTTVIAAEASYPIRHSQIPRSGRGRRL